MNLNRSNVLSFINKTANGKNIVDWTCFLRIIIISTHSADLYTDFERNHNNNKKCLLFVTAISYFNYTETSFIWLWDQTSSGQNRFTRVFSGIYDKNYTLSALL